MFGLFRRSTDSTTGRPSIPSVISLSPLSRSPWSRAPASGAEDQQEEQLAPPLAPALAPATAAASGALPEEGGARAEFSSPAGLGAGPFGSHFSEGPQVGAESVDTCDAGRIGLGVAMGQSEFQGTPSRAVHGLHVEAVSSSSRRRSKRQQVDDDMSSDGSEDEKPLLEISALKASPVALRTRQVPTPPSQERNQPFPDQVSPPRAPEFPNQSRDLDIHGQIADVRQKIQELQTLKVMRLNDEDFLGAHHAKQMIEEQERKLEALIQRSSSAAMQEPTSSGCQAPKRPWAVEVASPKVTPPRQDISPRPAAIGASPRRSSRSPITSPARKAPRVSLSIGPRRSRGTPSPANVHFTSPASAPANAQAAQSILSASKFSTSNASASLAEASSGTGSGPYLFGSSPSANANASFSGRPQCLDLDGASNFHQTATASFQTTTTDMGLGGFGGTPKSHQTATWSSPSRVAGSGVADPGAAQSSGQGPSPGRDGASGLAWSSPFAALGAAAASIRASLGSPPVTNQVEPDQREKAPNSGKTEKSEKSHISTDKPDDDIKVSLTHRFDMEVDSGEVLETSTKEDDAIGLELPADGHEEDPFNISPVRRTAADDDDDDDEEEEAVEPLEENEEMEASEWRTCSKNDKEVLLLPPNEGAQERGDFWLERETYDRLYPYQRDGVAWMARLWQQHHGGILADEMGLGKTVQVCSLLNGARKSGASHALLLLPITLIEQWAREARTWCPGWPVHIYYGSPAQRAQALRRVLRPQGGLLLTSYSMLANVEELLELTIDDTPSPTKRRGRPTQRWGSRRAAAGESKRRRLDDDDALEVDEFEEEQLVVEPPGGSLPLSGSKKVWDIVVCDEAHKMKNISTLLGKSLRQLKSKCRLLLTGTPVQNALQDLWALMDFAQPGLLGNHATFVKTFSDPIDRGSVRGAKVMAVELKKHLSEQLRGLISPHILRRTKMGTGLVKENEDEASDEEAGDAKRLPPKRETIVWLAPSPDQLELYQRALEKSDIIREACAKQKLGLEVFRAIGLLKRLCNHPALLHVCPKPGAWRDILAEATESAVAAATAAATASQAEASGSGNNSNSNNNNDSNSNNNNSSSPSAVPSGEEAGAAALSELEASSAEDVMASATEAEEFLDPSFGSGASAEVVGNVQDDAKGGRAVETILQKLPRDAEAMLGQSAKLVCLSKLLPKLAKQGHRTLVFSQSVKMLDLVQICCLKPNGLRCLRIDGQTDPASRAEKVAKFQREKERFQCMLLTSNVGGVGLNLTSADRVVLVDPSWNPATDAQAVDRAFRIGQEKEVRVYRLIMSGLIEDKMFRLQVFKMGLTKTALEADQKQCYFTAREIRALFEWTEPAVGETRKLLQDKHGSELDEAVFEAAKDDGSEEGWLSTTLGLSDFGSLYGASVEEDEPEEQDGASAALVLEAKEKLSAADEKLQKATEAKQAAEAAQEELRVNFEAASSACDLAREAKLAREEQAKEKAASLKHAKGAEQGAQKRLDKAFKAKAALQDSHFVAQQAAETAMGSLNTAEAAVADAIVAAKAIEGSFVKAFEAVEKQFSIVGPGGRAASADGVVDAKADATRKAVKALEKLKSTWETYCTRQAELDTAEDEFHKSEQLLAEAEREQTLLGNGDDDEGVAGSDAAKLAIARKGAELAKRGREKERLRAEQGLQKAQKKADDSREAAQQALQTLQEAGQAFVESFVKTTVRTVRADQVKAAQAATKASLRPLNSSFQSTKKGRDGVSKALQLRKKAQTKHASAATSEVEARMRLAEGEKEVEEANQEETALRAAREEAEARLAEAEAEKRNAEAEEVQSKKHRDELKAAMPGAKERVKEAKLAEKEATSERSALHAKCSKVEREKTQLEEAKSAAVQMLKAEEYDPSQVTNAYEKKAH